MSKNQARTKRVTRTVVPFIVAWVVSLSSRYEFVGDALDALAIDIESPTTYAALVVVVGAVYHAVASELQDRFPNSRFIARLLGSPGLPSYETKDEVNG